MLQSQSLWLVVTWIIILIFVECILLPIAIYGNVLLFRFRDALFIRKRSIFVLFGLNLSFCFVIFTVPVVLLISQFQTTHYFVTRSYLIFLLYVVIFFLNVRNWLILYRYKWNYYTIQYRWQSIINPSVSQQSNWYIRNYSKYGQTAYILKLFGIIHTISLIFNISGSSIRGDDIAFSGTRSIIASAVSVINGILLLLTYFIIIIQIPNFNDFYFIHWESKLQSRTIILFILVPVIGNIVEMFINEQLLFMVSSTIIVLIFFIMNWIATFGIVNKNMRYELSEYLSSSNKPAAVGIKLQDLLANEIALNAFVEHLFTELRVAVHLALCMFRFFCV